MPQLVHFTDNCEDIPSILADGFILRLHRRGLIQQFLDESLFAEREPQEFGMVCFTEIPISESALHRATFGQYGIGVTEEWAKRHRAQRVLYIPSEGPVFEAFQFLFRWAAKEVEADIAQHPDDACRVMTWTNKNQAHVFGCHGWETMLTVYEYMQPESMSPQVEWRIVQPLPLYSDATETIAEALQIARTWGRAGGFNNVKVRPADVAFLCCPAASQGQLREALPREFARVEIRTY
jgi:hypothetical protein